jgi:hypothetical protein
MTCRYYGKHQTLDGHLIDQLGNQCGAITTQYSPCVMELRGQIPNEATCAFADYAGQPGAHGGAGVIIVMEPQQ